MGTEIYKTLLEDLNKGEEVALITKYNLETKKVEKNIYNLEKYVYKTLKNNELSDKFIYINCTDNINDKKIINDLNDKLSIITDNEIVLPAIIYYKNGKPVDYIDSTNQILTGDKFVQLMDKWEVNK